MLATYDFVSFAAARVVVRASSIVPIVCVMFRVRLRALLLGVISLYVLPVHVRVCLRRHVALDLFFYIASLCVCLSKSGVDANRALASG